jgi:hypothetical protein
MLTLGGPPILDCMTPNLLPQLTTLLARLDEAAVAAAQQGDAQQNPYYAGLMIGLEIACDELAQMVDEALQAQVTTR